MFEMSERNALGRSLLVAGILSGIILKSHAPFELLARGQLFAAIWHEYRLIGLDGGLELNTSDGRPVQVNRDGTIINDLIG